MTGRIENIIDYEKFRVREMPHSFYNNNKKIVNKNVRKIGNSKIFRKPTDI